MSNFTEIEITSAFKKITARADTIKYAWRDNCKKCGQRTLFGRKVPHHSEWNMTEDEFAAFYMECDDTVLTYAEDYGPTPTYYCKTPAEKWVLQNIEENTDKCYLCEHKKIKIKTIMSFLALIRQ